MPSTVCACSGGRAHMHTNTHTSAYLHLFLCLRMCVLCVFKSHLKTKENVNTQFYNHIWCGRYAP